MKSEIEQNIVTSRFFYDPIVIAMAQITEFKNHPVQPMSIRKKVMENLEIEPGSLGRSKFGDNLTIKIRWALRNHSDKFSNSKRKRNNPFFLQERTGFWCLTDFGLSRAAILLKKEEKETETETSTEHEHLSETMAAEQASTAEMTGYEPEPGPEVSEKKVCEKNLTSEWFSNNWGTIYPMLTELIGNKFKVSKDTDQVSDLVMSFIVKAINKDSFRPVFNKGSQPTFGSVRMFAVRSAIDSIRKMGSDCGCRLLYGSRTSTEYMKDRQGGQYSVKDEYLDGIEERIFSVEKVRILKDRIIQNVPESRHESLMSVFKKVLMGEDYESMSEPQVDINRVKRLIRSCDIS